MGDAGLTGDLFGASMRTVSMRVVIVPPRFEGLPTASSQTVPMNGCFSLVLSFLMIDQRFRPTRRMLIPFTAVVDQPRRSRLVVNGVSR
jgi:hypothetical protein